MVGSLEGLRPHRHEAGDIVIIISLCLYNHCILANWTRSTTLYLLGFGDSKLHVHQYCHLIESHNTNTHLTHDISHKTMVFKIQANALNARHSYHTMRPSRDRLLSHVHPSRRESPDSSDIHLLRINRLILLTRFRPKLLLRQNPNHRQQSPSRICRLRTHTYPVLGPMRIELNILVQLPRIVVRIRLRHGIVGTQHLERTRVACRAVIFPG